MAFHRFIFVLSVIIAIANNEGKAIEYTSYFYTPGNVVFFAYEDGTSIALTVCWGNPIEVDPCNYSGRFIRRRSNRRV